MPNFLICLLKHLEASFLVLFTSYMYLGRLLCTSLLKTKQTRKTVLKQIISANNFSVDFPERSQQQKGNSSRRLINIWLNIPDMMN